jgi:hypothetical protein
MNERKGFGGADWIYNRGMNPEKVTESVHKAVDRTHLPARAVLVLAQLDPRAFGIACGVGCGIWLWLATIVLLIRGGPGMGRNLSLLSQYFIGFRITPAGSVLGFVYGTLAGFVIGYCFALLRNLLIRNYLLHIRRRSEREALADMLDHFM